MLPMIHSAYLNGLFLPAGVPPATVAACATWLALIFFVHVGVIGAMVAATFIDFDERTIPDAITLPGTLIGLLIAACSPMIFLPGLEPVGVGPVLFYSPETLTKRWMGVTGLMTGIGIWSTYCFAMADRRWIMRRGIVKAFAWFWHALTRTGTWKWLLMLWLVGIVVIGAVHWVGNRYWVGLLTSLSGLAVGGGLIWVVRLIGRLALGKEAMGFGDVTLMAMIGTFVGWQAALIAFFLSPMAACVIVLVRWVITREAATPYGPYLCAGVALTVAFWDSVYNRNLRLTLMMLGGNLLWFGVAMALALLAMLWMWRLVKEWLIQ
ncbi:MAG: A24 family peptidase [Planctomycetota bacterium]